MSRIVACSAHKLYINMSLQIFAGRNAGTNAGRKRRRTNAGERAIALSDSYVLHSSFKDDIHQFKHWPVSQLNFNNLSKYAKSNCCVKNGTNKKNDR